MAFCSLNPLLADAQVSCADWNTAKFFTKAKAHDVTRCVAAGSDPNLRGDAGYTPLHSAAANSTDPAVVARLLDAGADLESRGETGLTPLHAAAGGSSVPAVVTALANAGADLEARTESGLTPLHVAARSSSVPEVVTALVDAGADLWATTETESGFTALHAAAGSSRTPAVVTALVNAGADLEARTESGLTPLHVAAAVSDMPAIVTTLVNAGADPNARDQTDRTTGDYVQFNDALKDTEAYEQLKGAITMLGPDMVETWMKIGSMIVWGIAVLAGLTLWGLYSSRLGRRMREVGVAVMVMLTTLVSLLSPDWAVALYVDEPVHADLADSMVACIETGILVTWIVLGVVGGVHALLFRKFPSRPTRIAGGIVASLVVVVVSYHTPDWLFLFR